jgi:ribosomal protein S18 acetylase RimI-like enzyme
MVDADRQAIVRILNNTPEFSAEEVKVAIELIDIYLEQGISSGYYLAVSDAGPEPDGYICFGPTPMTEGTWDVYWIAVNAEKQNRGTGRILMEYAEEGIRNLKGRLILVETSSKPSYEKTRHFYDARKYEVIARIPDFYTIGDDKVVFAKYFKS